MKIKLRLMPLVMVMMLLFTNVALASSGGSFSPRVAPGQTLESNEFYLDGQQEYTLTCSTMNPWPNCRVSIINENGGVERSYLINEFHGKTISGLKFKTGQYKIRITNYMTEDLYIGVYLK